MYTCSCNKIYFFLTSHRGKKIFQTTGYRNSLRNVSCVRHKEDKEMRCEVLLQKIWWCQNAICFYKILLTLTMNNTPCYFFSLFYLILFKKMSLWSTMLISLPLMVCQSHIGKLWYVCILQWLGRLYVCLQKLNFNF